jgi:hypothetical protein
MAVGAGQGATVNVEAIGPGHRAGQNRRAGVLADAIVGGDSVHLMPGVSGLCSDDDQLG